LSENGWGHSDGIESLTDHSWKIDFGRTYYENVIYFQKNEVQLQKYKQGGEKGALCKLSSECLIIERKSLYIEYAKFLSHIVKLWTRNYTWHKFTGHN